jgi:hypothetical protein
MIEDYFVETSDVEELADNSLSSPHRWGGPVRNEPLEDPPRKRIKVCRSPAMLSICLWTPRVIAFTARSWRTGDSAFL